MKIKEMLLSGFVFTTFNWCPPKLDYYNMPKEKPQLPIPVHLNEQEVPITSEGNIANANQIRAWNQYIVYGFYKNGWDDIEKIKAASTEIVIVKDLNGNEIFI